MKSKMHPRAFESAVLRLIHAAEQVNENVMASGLAYRRDALRGEILHVRSLIDDAREARRAELLKDSPSWSDIRSEEPEESRHHYGGA